MSHFDRLASQPRPTGSAAADEARRYCAEVLRGLGFEPIERPFEYSSFPGKWATPLAGVLFPAVVTVSLAMILRGARYSAVMLLIGALVLFAVVGRYLAQRGVSTAPLLRRRGVNLEAARGSSPTVWLVAHIDSKWQPIPMLARATGVVGLSLVVIASLGVLMATTRSSLPPLAARSVSVSLMIAAWITALPVMLSVVGGRGHGAVDNASGVATVLAAAALLPPSAPIGVLITDAEELGLAGARAWIGGRTPGIALNCDSVDDTGRLTVMYTGAFPTAAVGAVRHACVESQVALRVIRLIPGVLTDSVAFADRGWTTLTLSRGDLGTLRRIHTARDTARAMRGTGIDEAARVLARAALELS